MLTTSAVLLAHQVQPPEPHHLWTAWNLHPLVVLGLAVPVAMYVRGRAAGGPGDEGWRGRCGALALGVLALALLSPLDALAHALASAHMVQHLLLTMVAAPLLAVPGSIATVTRGMPLALRGRVVRTLGTTGIGALVQAMQRPVVAWLLHVGALWIWHSAVLYDAALRHPLVHGLEHLSFIVTGVLFWHAVLGGRERTVSAGIGLVLVFTMALQGVVLSALLTFASTPWYGAYTATQKWGLDPLTDQQVAGVIMWIPGGLIYLGVALGLLVSWIREGDAAVPVGRWT